VNDNSIEKEIAEKTHQVVMDNNGGTKTIDLNEKYKSVPVLTDAQIKRVRDLNKKANHFFKHPQDIEFAFHNENLYLLQSRPITTLNTVCSWNTWEQLQMKLKKIKQFLPIRLD
jgi:pyruvate,water dikinase